MSDGSIERSLLEESRQMSSYAPELDLIAIEQNELVGSLLLTELGTTTAKLALLTTLCVIPSHQRRGIGTALVLRSIAAARALNFAGIVVEGDPAFFMRFGFQPSTNFNLPASRNLGLIDEQSLMILELTPNALAGADGEIDFSDFATFKKLS